MFRDVLLRIRTRIKQTRQDSNTWQEAVLVLYLYRKNVSLLNFLCLFPDCFKHLHWNQNDTKNVVRASLRIWPDVAVCIQATLMRMFLWEIMDLFFIKNTFKVKNHAMVQWILFFKHYVCLFNNHYMLISVYLSFTLRSVSLS